MADYEIAAKITADSKGFTTAIEKAEKSTKSFSARITDIINKVGKNGLTQSLANINLATQGVTRAFSGVTSVVNKVTSAISDCSKEARQNAKEQQLLQQTLKVTGADTWTTVDALNAQAEAIQSSTNYSAGEINQLQTVLLGFKSITGDIFDKTTDSILDMATVMGMDLTNATQTVAKALDDPIKGLGSLSRQGFVFSQSQKEMIQNFIDLGEKEKAQKIILDELESTYGGASRVAVDGSKQLSNAIKDLKTEIGKFFEESYLGKIRSIVTQLINEAKDKLEEINEDRKKTDSVVQYEKRSKTGTLTDEDVLNNYERKVAELQQLIAENQNVINLGLSEQLFSYQEISQAQNKVKNYSIELSKLEIERNQILENQKRAEEERLENIRQQEEAEKKAMELAKQRQADEDLRKYIQENEEALEKTINSLVREAQLRGEIVDTQQLLNTYISAYTSLIEDSDGRLEEGNEYVKERKRVLLGVREVLEWENENAKKTTDEFKEQNKEIKAEESNLKKIGSSLVNITNNISNVTNKIVNSVKNVVTTVSNSVTKLINFNFSTAIDDLLSFEDKVLTFILSFSDKIPKFIDTLFSSINILLGQVLNTINVDSVTQTIVRILTTISNNAPAILDKLATLIDVIMSGFVDGVIEWLDNGGLETLLNAILSFQKSLEDTVRKLLSKLVPAIKQELPKIVEFLKSSIISASETLADILPDLVDIIMSLITAIIDVAFSPDVIRSSFGVIEAFIKAIIEKVLPAIIDILGGLLSDPMKLLELVFDLIDGIANAFLTADWSQIGNAFADVFSNLFKNLGDWFNSPEAGEKIGGMIDTLMKVIAGFLTGGLSWLFEGIGAIFGWNKKPDNPQQQQQDYSNAMSQLQSVVNQGGEQGQFAQNIIDQVNAIMAKTQMEYDGHLFNGNTTATRGDMNIVFNNTADTTAQTIINELRYYDRQLAVNGF